MTSGVPSAQTAKADSYQRICGVSDVGEGKAVGLEIDGHPIMVVHTEGRYFALRDVCSHAEVALSDGEIEGCTVECWLHGSRFDLRTGTPLELPATEPVQTYAVQVSGDDILVALTPPLK
ncbi:MAG: hypothetical protein DLM55_11015 [Acidimicrobiales bacterium]|nr:MAG: hypothetical protein DLM55_11015 [Acidimicrobiales bacterium]